jgi:hypothetical protein
MGGYEEVHVFGPDYQGNVTFRNITVGNLCFVLPPFLYFANKARKSETRWKYLVFLVSLFCALSILTVSSILSLRSLAR